MNLHKFSTRIRTDIGFSWFSVYTGSVVKKSTKNTTQAQC